MVRMNRDYLYKLIHPVTNVEMTFDPWIGEGSTSEFARPGVTYVLPGTNSPVDAYGDAANPMSGRTYSFKFIRAYKTIEEESGSRLETFTEAQDEFRRMVVHGKRMTAVKKTTKGTYRYGRFKLISLPDAPSDDDFVAAVFTATFDMTPPWWTDLYPSSARIYDLDPDMTYDVGDYYYDDDGFHLNATSKTIEVDSTAATLPDYGAKFTIYGPFGGDGGIVIVNTSLVPMYYFNILTKLAANQMIVVESATEAVRLNAVPRPDLLSIPRGQFDVMLLESGIKNELLVQCVGSNQVSGGYMTVESMNKYA